MISICYKPITYDFFWEFLLYSQQIYWEQLRWKHISRYSKSFFKLAFFMILLVNLVEKPDERTTYCVGQVYRYSITYLFVLGRKVSFELPIVRECLYAGILAYREWARFNGVAAFRLLLSRGTCQC